MKILKVIVAASFAIIATGAFADTSVWVNLIDSVNNVDGRGFVTSEQVAGTAVTRPANEVVLGQTIQEGPAPVAIRADELDVNMVPGRS